MSNRIASHALVLAALVLVPVPSRVMAQGVLDRVKKRAEESAKQKVEDRLSRKADAGIDKVLDGAENAITCVATDKACIQKAEKSGSAVVLTDAAGKEVSRRPAAAKATETSGGADAETGGAVPAARQRAGEGAWANYDFVPGEKPLLSDDFSKDVIGDFPRRLEASSGNVELVTWKGGRWLQMSGNNDNKFYVPAGAKLPSRWTLEFDFVSDGRRECWIYPSGVEGDDYVWFGAKHDGGMQRKDGRSVGTRATDESLSGTPFTARIMVDGRYIKAYVNERRVVNIPNLDYTPSDKVLFYCDGKPEEVVLLNNIRLAAGGRKLYDALAESGRVATQGIFFDVGSDRIRPESSPTLKEIGEMLTEHGTLKLLIEGHTDNTGVTAGNLALSQKRAEAVRAYLTSTYGIEAARLSAKGMGQTVPAAPNTTPEGRQQNRRVELVKQP
jgi:OmpA-OmpF porin, OOP family